MTSVMNERVYLFDTTLRDGMQTVGIEATVKQKNALAILLDDHVDFIEGGYPGANVVDTEFFENPPRLKTPLIAFGMTMRHSFGAPENDPGLVGIFNSGAKGVCLVGKGSALHARKALEITPEQNLEVIDKSIRAAVDRGLVAMLDMEHFFDGYYEDPAYSLAVLRTAEQAGASWMVMCDTNGGTTYDEVGRITREVIAAGFDGKKLGIHAHDDMGYGVANSIEAVRAGARMVQGTMNGLGERCGNANLITVIGNLVKQGYNCGVDAQELSELRHLSMQADTILDIEHNQSAPYVGDRAFATKAGIHASALAKDFSLYCHIPAETVGNKVKIIGGSAQSGMSNLKSKVQSMGLAFDPKAPHWKPLMESIKAMEGQGYAFDQAEAMLELLINDACGLLPRYFEIDDVTLRDTIRATGQKDDYVSAPTARVKMFIGPKAFISEATGNGPVNAITLAVRKTLESSAFYPELADMHLYDFRVRIVDALHETGALTRVRLDSRSTRDSDVERWSTQGVSPDIIKASMIAELASIRWYLHQRGIADRASVHGPVSAVKIGVKVA